VERQDIRIGRLKKISPESVDNRVCDFVHNDIMRETGEHILPWDILPRIRLVGLEITEEHRIELWIKERIGSVECMRNEA
jgi:hypothetical protein